MRRKNQALKMPSWRDFRRSIGVVRGFRTFAPRINSAFCSLKIDVGMVG